MRRRRSTITRVRQLRAALATSRAFGTPAPGMLLAFWRTFPGIRAFGRPR